MSLYDDDEIGSAEVAKTDEGWSRGVLQLKTKTSALAMQPSSMTSAKPAPTATKLAMKQAYTSPLAAVAAAKLPARPTTITTTVLGLSNSAAPFANSAGKKRAVRHGLLSGKDRNGGDKKLLPLGDPNWTVVNEYDPLWPNDYTKVVADIRDSKRAAAADDENASGKRRYTEGVRDKARERFHGRAGTESGESSGFGRRPRGQDDYSDEEDDEDKRGSHRRSAGSAGGAAIAPPPSLTESTNTTAAVEESSGQAPGNNAQEEADTKGGLGVAAKIMAKYGYKQGQGLGRTQQGMSQALAVEKTSKRGGRIVHENDFKKPPPMFGESFKTPPSLSMLSDEYNDMEGDAGSGGEDEYGNPNGGTMGMMPPPPPGMSAAGPPADTADEAPKPSITDLMKNPSKVVLCKNMVGPGEVDPDLEPEVKEECNGKYGDVNKVVIFEMPNVTPEEAVRIFIEFKRVESAIKAVVDLNGRFFGGREVQARFYDQDKFSNLSLYD